MRRPHFQSIYMRLALNLAERSTCKRLQVGCVITSLDFRQVYALGYNGNAVGLPHTCDYPTTPGACGCVHAETNSVINSTALRHNLKLVFVTHGPPCVLCAKMLVNLGGVVTVYCATPYRISAGAGILDVSRIPLVHLTEKEIYGIHTNNG